MELTLEILDKIINELPPVTYPRKIRISFGDYHKLREASDIFKFIPESPKGYTQGFCGEIIIPDIDVVDGCYELDW